jgi:hypothetical protein
MTGIPPSARNRHPRWNPRVTLGANPPFHAARVPPYLQAFRGERVAIEPSCNAEPEVSSHRGDVCGRDTTAHNGQNCAKSGNRLRHTLRPKPGEPEVNP